MLTTECLSLKYTQTNYPTYGDFVLYHFLNSGQLLQQLPDHDDPGLLAGEESKEGKKRWKAHQVHHAAPEQQ